MANAKKCDRCGNYYSMDEKNFKVNGATLYRVVLSSRYGSGIYEADLCDDCARDLWHWLCNDQEVDSVEELNNVFDLSLMKNYLLKSMRDCSLTMDECEDEGTLDRLAQERDTYRSVLSFVNTFIGGDNK